MWWKVREVHLLLLHFKGLTELLDARFGTTYTIHPLREKQKQKTVIRPQLALYSLYILVTVVIHTWTERARLSISNVQSCTTKGTWSGLSRGSRERSTPNTVPFLCSHSNWHTSMHFLCKASPHWSLDRISTDHINNFIPNLCGYSTCIGLPLPFVLIPPHIQFHWQQCSCHTACILPSCSSSSWVGVSVQLVKLCALWVGDHQCTL